MAYTISDLKNDISRKLHGTSLAKVVDVYNVIYTSGRNLLLEIDPFETKRVSQIENALYDRVYRYTVPTDLKSDKIINIYPQSGQTLVSDNFIQTYAKPFNLRKPGQSFSIDVESNLKFIDLNETLLTPGVLISGMNAPTNDNGTWITGGDASNIVANTIRFVSGSGSLQFDLTHNTGIGYIENSTLQAVDLTKVKGYGAVFVYVELPTAANFTSVNIRFGSSPLNYYTATVTADHNSLAFVNGFNLLRYDWANLSTTGTPVITAINYARITYNFTATTLAVGADSLTAKVGTLYNMLYYSEWLYRDGSTGSWKESPTADSDVINLSNVSYNLLLSECMLELAQQVQGEEDSADVEFYRNKLYGDTTGQNPGMYKNYRDQYKSETIKRQNQYYRTRHGRC